MIFKNRLDAAEKLLKKLKQYENKKMLIVVGIPRGAVPMAAVIAKGLKAELNVVLVHKIPAPMDEEFAIASVGISGHIERLKDLMHLSISDNYIEREAERQLQVLKSRQKLYDLSVPIYHDKTVIIVDDGIATGATTLAAVYEVRHQKPKKIIVAAPVSSQDSYLKLQQEVDEMVVLHIPPIFYAVGQFYEQFEQIDDETVGRILKNS